MKKNIVYGLVLSIIVFLTTGCVKFNYDMEIKPTKAMNISAIFAVDTSVFGDEGTFDEDGIKALKDNGYKVEEYKDGSYKGVKIIKSIKNIDSVSSTKDVEYDLSGSLSKESIGDMIFKVEKGFLKNKYTATFKFDSSDNPLGDTDSLMSTDMDTDDEEESDDDWSGAWSNEDDDTTDGWSTDTTLDSEEEDDSSIEGDLSVNFDEEDEDDSMDLDDAALEQMMSSNLDLSFSVKLPSKALSNNATDVAKGGKQLTWKLNASGATDIKFSFEVYNLLPICIIGGAIGLIILVIIISVISKNKKKKAMNAEAVIAADTPVQSTEQPVTPVVEAPSVPNLQPAASATPTVLPQVETTAPVAPTPAESTPVEPAVANTEQPASDVVPATPSVEQTAASTVPTEPVVSPEPVTLNTVTDANATGTVDPNQNV